MKMAALTAATGNILCTHCCHRQYTVHSLLPQAIYCALLPKSLKAKPFFRLNALQSTTTVHMVFYANI